MVMSWFDTRNGRILTSRVERDSQCGESRQSYHTPTPVSTRTDVFLDALGWPWATRLRQIYQYSAALARPLARLSERCAAWATRPRRALGHLSAARGLDRVPARHRSHDLRCH